MARPEKPQRRQSPQLPSRREDYRLLTTAENLDDEPLDECLLAGVDGSSLHLRGLNVGASLFEGVSFANSDVVDARLRDTRFINCDLSNAVWRGFKAARVEFMDCRLTGFAAPECRWQDVLIENCDGRYGQFAQSRIQRSEIVGSSFVEADFRGADFEATVFERASLIRADLSRAKLRKTDLRGADLEGITVLAEDVAGAIVSPSQAMDLARLLGLEIR